MRYREWLPTRWQKFFRRSCVVSDVVSKAANRYVDYKFIDTGLGDRLRNTIADRCELVTGLILTAEIQGRIGSHHALVVVGSGPTATIATLVAMARRIRVVHIHADGAEEMTPLAGANTRWVSPYFYDTLDGFPVAPDRWSWSLPGAFKDMASDRLAKLERFGYGHQSAGSIADEWIAAAATLR